MTETKTYLRPFPLAGDVNTTAVTATVAALPDLITPPPFCISPAVSALPPGPAPESAQNPDRPMQSFPITTTSTRYATTFKTPRQVSQDTKPAIIFGGSQPEPTDEARSPPLQTAKGNVIQPGGDGVLEPQRTGSSQRPVTVNPQIPYSQPSQGSPRSGLDNPEPQSLESDSGGKVAPTQGSSPQQQGHSPDSDSDSNPVTLSDSKGSHLSGAVVNNVPVAAGPSQILIGSKTFPADSLSTHVEAVYGQTFTILPSNRGVIAPGGVTVSAAPNGVATPEPIFTMADVPFAGVPFHPGKLRAGSSLLQLPSAGQSVLTISGHTFTLSPSEIIGGDSTVTVPPVPAATLPHFKAETVNNVPIDVGANVAIIGSLTIPIGLGASPTTFVVSGETVMAASDGLRFPGASTTVATLPPSSIASAGGITFAIEPSAVVVSGTTYFFSHPTEVMVGTETVSIGPEGVIMPSTTIHPISITQGPTFATATTVITSSAAQSEASDKEEGIATSGASTASASPTNAATALKTPTMLWPVALALMMIASTTSS